MPFMHPLYDPKDDEVQPPAGCMTEEQLDYFSEQTRRAVRSAVINYSRGAMVGFLVLLVGLVLAFQRQGSGDDNAQEAIVKSGQAIAVEGCNRDFRNVEKFRDLLGRLAQANEDSYKKGRITSEQYVAAQAFYKNAIQEQRLPDCRDSRDILTSDPSDEITVPVPLYPKG